MPPYDTLGSVMASPATSPVKAPATPTLPVTVERLVRARIPTMHGNFNVSLYRSSRDPAKEHLAIVYGDVTDQSKVRDAGDATERATVPASSHTQFGGCRRESTSHWPPHRRPSCASTASASRAR